MCLKIKPGDVLHEGIESWTRVMILFRVRLVHAVQNERQGPAIDEGVMYYSLKTETPGIRVMIQSV